MNSSEIVLFLVDVAVCSTRSPTGSPTLANFRVETPGEHAVHHRPRERIPIGEVLIRRDRQLALVVG
jgi:hypothetical protein